jgi:hypothetical protein
MNGIDVSIIKRREARTHINMWKRFERMQLCMIFLLHDITLPRGNIPKIVAGHAERVFLLLLQDDHS